MLGRCMKSRPSWEKYHEKAKSLETAPLLVEAVQYVAPGLALELGAGTPRDSEFLLGQGFQVLAVDNTDSSKNLFTHLQENPGFRFEQASFEQFTFAPAHYDLISAQLSLPFIKKREDFERVLLEIKVSLKPGGVFVAHFFGPKDTWSTEKKALTFVTKEELEHLLEGLEMLKFEEREWDADTLLGVPHHWHRFDVIVKK